MFVFTKEMAALLRKIREKAGLTQKEVALRMGIKTKSGQSIVARLESGIITNPTLATIMNYLDACGVRMSTFFDELSAFTFKQKHDAIISQAKLPADINMRKKIDRDTMLYEVKIKPPGKEPLKIDMERVKKKIENKVKMRCYDLKIKDDLITKYLDFANEILTAAKYQPIIGKYIGLGLHRPYLIGVIRIANKIYHSEEKKVGKKRPLTPEKQKEMAVKFVSYRVAIEQIETEVHKILNEYVVGEIRFPFYKDFARACYKALRKYSVKDPLLLKQRLREIEKAWLEAGLKQDVLEKVKEATIKVFRSLQGGLL